MGILVRAPPKSHKPPNIADQRTAAVDVNIYASDPSHAKPLIGNHENTDIGAFIRDYLDVDVDAVTEELKEAAEKGALDMGDPVSDERAMAAQDHYHGEFKRGLEEWGHVH